MPEASRERALHNFRKWLTARAHFEVLGMDADQDLIRGPRPGSHSNSRAVTGEAPRKGGILEALRRLPLVGADLNVTRPVVPARRVDL